MSRSNPFKQKRRAAKTTLLIFGEGLNEEVFLRHLRGLYAHNSNVGVVIRKGKGGDASSIIVDAANTPGMFDRKVVVLDNDKSGSEMGKARQEAAKRGIQLIENTPCLEAILLSVLNGGKSFSGQQSGWCKKEFESSHLDKKKRTEPTQLAKAFPKTLLEGQRSNVPTLNALIALMEGQS